MTNFLNAAKNIHDAFVSKKPKFLNNHDPMDISDLTSGFDLDRSLFVMIKLYSTLYQGTEVESKFEQILSSFRIFMIVSRPSSSKLRSMSVATIFQFITSFINLFVEFAQSAFLWFRDVSRDPLLQRSSFRNKCENCQKSLHIVLELCLIWSILSVI